MHVEPTWIIVALTAVGMIVAFARAYQRVHDQMRTMQLDMDRRERQARGLRRAMLTRIVDLEKAYELIGMPEEERLKRDKFPRRFVPRVHVALIDEELEDDKL